MPQAQTYPIHFILLFIDALQQQGTTTVVGIVCKPWFGGALVKTELGAEYNTFR